MTIREAAEILYDEYTGTTGLLGNSTQEARWIAFTEKVIAVAGVENSMLISLADVWDEGYRACLEDTYKEETFGNREPIPNPYVEEA